MAEFSTPSAAHAKRENICSVSETEYNMWRHHPVSAGFVQYMEDLVAFYRESVADMLESGLFLAGDHHQDRNPDVMRGQIIMLRQLHGVTIDQIKEFYAPPAAGGEEAEQKETAYEE